MNDKVFTPPVYPRLKYSVDQFGGVEYDDSNYDDCYLSSQDLIAEIEGQIQLSIDASMPLGYIDILYKLLLIAKEDSFYRSYFGKRF